MSIIIKYKPLETFNSTNNELLYNNTLDYFFYIKYLIIITNK